jgi:hypothetical protein
MMMMMMMVVVVVMMMMMMHEASKHVGVLDALKYINICCICWLHVASRAIFTSFWKYM